MSEIKGQLLGIVLTVAIFGIVAGVMQTAFKNMAQDVASQVENVTLPPASTTV